MGLHPVEGAGLEDESPALDYRERVLEHGPRDPEEKTAILCCNRLDRQRGYLFRRHGVIVPRRRTFEWLPVGTAIASGFIIGNEAPRRIGQDRTKSRTRYRKAHQIFN